LTSDSFALLFQQSSIGMKIYNLSFLLLFQFLSCKQASESSQAHHLPDVQQKQKTDTAIVANLVFESTDGGQTWQDIIAPVKSGTFVCKYWGVHLKNTKGTSVWSPIFENFQEPRIRSVFETAGGTIFIGIDRGIFKSTDNGNTWKHVFAGGLVGHLAESDGVLLSVSMGRIIRSTDNGENWAVVISDSNVAFDVKPFKGGFAAMTATSVSNPRWIRASYDRGKTWQSNNAQDKVVMDSIWRTWNNRPRLQAFMTSIIQFDENFYCTDPEGIFRSSDKGKTWKLLLPSIKGKVFNLSVSGNVMYAFIPRNRGC